MNFSFEENGTGRGYLKMEREEAIWKGRNGKLVDGMRGMLKWWNVGNQGGNAGIGMWTIFQISLWKMKLKVKHVKPIKEKL